MTFLYTLLINNRIARAIGLAALLGGLAKLALALARRGGVKAERAKAKEEDMENAQDIRERVATGRLERVHSVKDRGYRD